MAKLINKLNCVVLGGNEFQLDVWIFFFWMGCCVKNMIIFLFSFFICLFKPVNISVQIFLVIQAVWIEKYWHLRPSWFNPSKQRVYFRFSNRGLFINLSFKDVPSPNTISSRVVLSLLSLPPELFSPFNWRVLLGKVSKNQAVSSMLAMFFGP